MFSYDQRLKAVKLLIQYDLSYSTVIRELGYPSRRSLREWYYEYIKEGDLHREFIKNPTYSEEEKQKAVVYYLEHGKCVSRTVKKIGYPSRPTLDKWILELAPEGKKHCKSGGYNIKYSQKEKEEAVISLCTRTEPAKDVASKYGVNRETLYNWKNQLSKKESVDIVNKKPRRGTKKTRTNEEKISQLKQQRDELSLELSRLQKEVHRLKIEKDIYEKAAEILKKGQGISIEVLTNREKAMIISALKEKYLLKELLVILNMAKSSYFYQLKSLNTDKYHKLKGQIKSIFKESYGRYGYRRIHSVIKTKGITVSEKVIRRIMKEENLHVPYNKRRKYNSYKGEISPGVDNIINRDFHAEEPNKKWLTDLTEFHIPAGKVYLSPIIDCFDGLPVSWSIGTSPSSELVNTMLDGAIKTLKKDEKPILHSDRGCHYRWPGWIERMDKANLIRSMSKKGCSPDNAACEGFFGRLKNEMFYGYSWADVTIENFIEILNNYMIWYTKDRIKLSLGGTSPLDYRKSLGYAT